MTANGSNHRAAERLDSWKEIASFFGRDERTVRRWEQRGLPVYRLPGGGKTTVYAFVVELEAWLRKDGPSAVTDTQAVAGSPAHGASAEDVAAGPEPDRPARHGARYRHWRLALIAAALFGLALAASVSLMRHAEPGNGTSTNAQARGYYLKGRYSWQTRTPAGLTQAIGDFDRAIAADPHFAPAWVGLADAYSLMPEYAGMPAAIAFPKAQAAARRAIALDGTLADAHRALGFADFWWSHDVAGAMAEFRRAVALDPRSAQTRHWYATALAMIGDNREALAQIAAAEELAPGSTAIQADKGLLLSDAGRSDEALQILKQVETAEPGFAPVHAYLGAVYTRQNNAIAALRERALCAGLIHDQAELAVVDAGEQGYRAGGIAEMARRLAAKEQTLHDLGQYSAFPVALAYAALGDRERALRLLEEAVEHRESLAMGMRIEPAFRNLHGDPRFAALLAREGLPPLVGE